MDCQRNKVNTHPRKAPLSPITPVTEALPFQTIAMDFIVKLPESAGFDSILTIMDHDCMKMLITIPCRETIMAEGVAELFLRQVFPRFGLPSKIISDRDPRFISKFMKELCRLMGITQNISTAYHPRTDGQSERSNQWLEQYLCFWVDHQQCQELDGSWLLSVSKTVDLWRQGSVVQWSEVQMRAQSSN